MGHSTRLRMQLNMQANIFGVKFDSILRLSAQTTVICDERKNNNKVLYALAGIILGVDKQTLLTSCNTIRRSEVNYTATVGSANTSASR